MKILSQIALFVCLCFAFKAQAQITSVDYYSNKISRLPADQKEKLEFLFFGPVSRLYFKERTEPAFLWKEQGPVKTIEIDSKQIGELKNMRFSDSFKTAEVISITWEKGKSLPLSAEHLAQFKNLKYLLISGYDKVEINELKNLLKDLISSAQLPAQIEIIYLKLELPS